MFSAQHLNLLLIETIRKFTTSQEILSKVQGQVKISSLNLMFVLFPKNIQKIFLRENLGKEKKKGEMELVIKICSNLISIMITKEFRKKVSKTLVSLYVMGFHLDRCFRTIDFVSSLLADRSGSPTPYYVTCDVHSSAFTRIGDCTSPDFNFA